VYETPLTLAPYALGLFLLTCYCKNT